jgi:hypothetical protein
VAPCCAPHCGPLFLRDGFKESLSAILGHLGFWMQPERRQATGPSPQPRWMPRPGRRYAPGLNTTRRRRLVRVPHRVVFGTLAAVEPGFAACGWHINTAFIERLTLSIRHQVAAIGRRVATRGQGADGWRQQLAVSHVDEHFCLPHASVCQALPQPEPTPGSGAATRWPSQTPAMAAGLTDHVWTLREMLRCRVPPWPQPAGV